MESNAGRIEQRMNSRTAGQKFKRWLEALPDRTRRYSVPIASLAATAAVYAWETRNATLGFEQEFKPGIVWAIIGAVGASLASLLAWRWAMEAFRKVGGSPAVPERPALNGSPAIPAQPAISPDPGQLFPGLVSLVVAIIATAVLLFGVWSNFAADGVRRGTAHSESSTKRDSLLKDLHSIESDLRDLPKTLELGLEADRKDLAKQLTIGRQWGLTELNSEPGGDCDQSFKGREPYQRSICNKAADLRASITRAEAAINLRSQLQKDAAAKQAEIDALPVVAGTEEYGQLAQMLGKEGSENLIQSFAKLALSLAFLIMAMFLFDRTLEGRGRKTGG